MRFAGNVGHNPDEAKFNSKSDEGGHKEGGSLGNKTQAKKKSTKTSSKKPKKTIESKNENTDPNAHTRGKYVRPLHFPPLSSQLCSQVPKFDIILVTVEMKCKSDLQNGEKRTTLLHSISAKNTISNYKGLILGNTNSSGGGRGN